MIAGYGGAMPHEICHEFETWQASRFAIRNSNRLYDVWTNALGAKFSG